MFVSRKRSDTECENTTELLEKLRQAQVHLYVIYELLECIFSETLHYYQNPVKKFLHFSKADVAEICAKSLG